VLYLLHGLSDDYSVWMRRTSIERYVEGLPLIVVMPDTGRGWYTNGKTPGTHRYEDHIIQDVVGTVDRLFPTIAARKGRVIGGLSMGGYGAVKLALKYPDLFCAAHSHSGALTGPRRVGGKWTRKSPIDPEFAAIFGKHLEDSQDDPSTLARQCPKTKRPALRIDCGSEDFLIDANRYFHDLLKELKYPHEYEEHPGSHNWGYWDLHIRAALDFHRRHLKIG
jgi:putative tributyrin esterase